MLFVSFSLSKESVLFPFGIPQVEPIVEKIRVFVALWMFLPILNSYGTTCAIRVSRSIGVGIEVLGDRTLPLVNMFQAAIPPDAATVIQLAKGDQTQLAPVQRAAHTAQVSSREFLTQVSVAQAKLINLQNEGDTADLSPSRLRAIRNQITVSQKNLTRLQAQALKATDRYLGDEAKVQALQADEEDLNNLAVQLINPPWNSSVATAIAQQSLAALAVEPSDQEGGTGITFFSAYKGLPLNLGTIFNAIGDEAINAGISTVDTVSVSNVNQDWSTYQLFNGGYWTTNPDHITYVGLNSASFVITVTGNNVTQVYNVSFNTNDPDGTYLPVYKDLAAGEKNY
jgi:hypothetical protein